MRQISSKITLVVFFCLLSGSLWSQGHLLEMVTQAWEQPGEPYHADLFLPSSRSLSEDPQIEEMVEGGTLLELDLNALSQVLEADPKKLVFSVPDGQGGNVELKLIPSNLFSGSFTAQTSSQEDLTASLSGLHFQGIVDHVNGSLGAISLFDNHMMGLWATPNEGNLVLGQIPSGPLEGLYIVYADADLLQRPDGELGFDEVEVEGAGAPLTDPGAQKTGKTDAFERCVTTFIEVDPSLLQGFGSTLLGLDYTIGCFNITNTVFINDLVQLVLNGVHLWTTPSPYSTTINTAGLDTYRQSTPFAGSANLLQLWTGDGGGGRGYRPNDMCNPNAGYSMAAMFGWFNVLPFYSWDVNVSAHEWGHNLTLHHSHWCGWPNGPMDNCEQPDGSCLPGPIPANGGTIMSYCHTLQTGINFANGFGPDPGNAMRAAVAASTCSPTCDPIPCIGQVRYIDCPQTEYMYAIVNNHGRGDLLKIQKPTGTGFNMFAMEYNGAEYVSIPNGGQLVGTQVFSSEITNVLFSGNFTVVTLKDGKVLKVFLTGGLGSNMFQVTETATQFNPIPGTTHYVGDHYFEGVCTDIVYTGAETMMAFYNKKILKVLSVGGAGHQMFQVTENPNGFDPITNSIYYRGDGSFLSAPVRILYTGSHTLIAFKDGKILKVNAFGGTGHNLFAVTETATDFAGLAGYNIYRGDIHLSSFVTTWVHNGASTLIGFANQKMLKVAGTGGSGNNMFAVTETANGFNGVSGYNYYLGDDLFQSVPIDIEETDQQTTFISFIGNKILKVLNYGGTGHNMFGVNETATGFSSSGAGSPYIGNQYFNYGYPIDVEFIEGNTYVGLTNLRGLKIWDDGGSGNNMFAVVETPFAFVPSIGFFHYAGDQYFECIPFKEHKLEASEPALASELEELVWELFPNPADQSARLRFELAPEDGRLQVVNALGKIVEVQPIEGETELQIDLQALPAGIYFVEVWHGSHRSVKTLSVQH